MTARRMTQSEAVAFFELAYNLAPDHVTSTHVEACVAGYDAEDAAEALHAYCAGEIGDIDAASLLIRVDHTDDGDMPAVHIHIKTAEVAE